MCGGFNGQSEYSDALEPVNPQFRASDNTPHYESLEGVFRAVNKEKQVALFSGLVALGIILVGSIGKDWVALLPRNIHKG